MPTFRHAILLPLLLQAATAVATQDVAAIDRAVAAWLTADGGSARAMPVDRRLRLLRCPAPLAIAHGEPGTLAVRCAALGWRIRVPLVEEEGATAELTPRATAPTATPRVRALVVRGQQVTVVVAARGFTVSSAATALDGGGEGDRVRLRTAARAAPIVGTILADGRVSVAALN